MATFCILIETVEFMRNPFPILLLVFLFSGSIFFQFQLHMIQLFCTMFFVFLLRGKASGAWQWLKMKQ